MRSERPILKTIYIDLAGFFFRIQFQFFPYLIGEWDIVSETEEIFIIMRLIRILGESLIYDPDRGDQISDPYEKENPDSSEEYSTDFLLFVSFSEE